jgi:serpin B
MSPDRRHFLRSAAVLAGGAAMPLDLFAKRRPDDLGAQTGINPFAFDLHAKLGSTKGNVFVSPFSISSALAMTAGGAEGNTLKQMAKTLRCPGTSADPIGHALFGELMFQLAGPQKRLRPFQLHVANGLFAQKGYPWKKDFLERATGKYFAEIRDVNFANASEAARKSINDWTETQTMKKIKDLFAEGTIDALTRLVLVNAIYFKANWEKPFPKAATKELPFLLADGAKPPVPTMFAKVRSRLAETDDVQFLELPYSSSQTSMAIVLPRKADGLADVEKGFDAAKWAALAAALKPAADVEVYLPKFKVETKYDLNDTLKDMGMTDAFDFAKANFDGMTTTKPEGPLAITKVVHKAYCEVDEQGTEAAAATGVAVGLRGAPTPAERKIFRADHPFLFAIRHNASNAILFLGRLSNPKA